MLVVRVGCCCRSVRTTARAGVIDAFTMNQGCEHAALERTRASVWLSQSRERQCDAHGGNANMLRVATRTTGGSAWFSTPSYSVFATSLHPLLRPDAAFDGVGIGPQVVGVRSRRYRGTRSPRPRRSVSSRDRGPQGRKDEYWGTSLGDAKLSRRAGGQRGQGRSTHRTRHSNHRG